MISFEAKYYILKLLAIILAAAAIGFLLYYRNKDNNELSKNQSIILTILRFSSFFLIAILLLVPFFHILKKTVQKPKIIVAYDNSASMISAVDSGELKEVVKGIREKISGSLINDYSVINYLFGHQARISDDLDFRDKGSDYSRLISTIVNNHYNVNIGALILIGDGTYNMGRNPVNMMNDISFPVFTIGMGDTTEVADGLIRDVRANRTSFTGNRFPVEIDCKFVQLKERNIKLSISQGGSIITETVIKPDNNDFFHTQQFILDAGSPGLKTYSVSLEVSPNERNKTNNVTEFVINVLENKQKILILSDGPHPDIGAIRNTLEQQQSFDVTAFYEDPYPSNLTDYNLIILNQLPTTGKSISDIFGNEKNQRIPVLFMIGSTTYIPQLNILDRGVNIQILSTSPEEAQPVINESFGLFNLSDEFRESIPKFPPLQAHFANYRLEPGISILLYQKINNIETSKPLMAAGIYRGRKTGFIFGEGIWKWRLYDYLLNQNHDQFDELTSQLVQYLALRENEDNFMIQFEPVYSEVEEVIMKAEVYNDAFEIINNAEIIITIENEDGNKFNFTFDSTEKGYILNAGNLPVGDYLFNAEVLIGGDKFTEQGKFSIKALNIENIITKANHRILYQIAENSGGDFFTPSELENLTTVLKKNSNIKTTIDIQKIIYEILNLKGLFFVLIILLSLEWFLRKYWGIY